MERINLAIEPFGPRNGEYYKCSNLARSILALVDTIYTPRYYIPGEINPRSLSKKEVFLGDNIDVFPNPTTGLINIVIPKIIADIDYIQFIDLNGKTILLQKLNYGQNEFDLASANFSKSSGLLMYVIYSKWDMIKQGKFFLINE